MNADDRCMLNLCRAGLLEIAPGPMPPDADISRVWTISATHKVSALVAGAALKYCDLTDSERRLAKVCIDAARYAEAIQYFELTELFRRFEEAGVDYCPLKGWYWQALYAAPYLREKGDVDFLVRLEQWKDACRIVRKQGFERAEKMELNMHSVFFKEDVKIEVHRTLVPARRKREARYIDLWKRLEPGSAPHEWRMPPTDDYLYFFLHAEKHVAEKCFVLRMLTDLYLLRHFGPTVDRARFLEQADRLRLRGYAENMEGLADAWLNGNAFTAAQEELLDYLLNLIRISGAEQDYREARHWLSFYLSPLALIRRLHAPRKLLLARFEDTEGAQTMRHGFRHALDIYRMYIRKYRNGLRKIPFARRRALKRGYRALFRR